MGGKRGRKAEFTGSYECKNCGKIDIPGIETVCVKETFITYGLLARLGTRKEEDELRECRLCRPCYARLNRLTHDLMGAERCQSRTQRPSKVRKTVQKVPIRDDRPEDAPPENDCLLITEELRRRLIAVIQHPFGEAGPQFGRNEEDIDRYADNLFNIMMESCKPAYGKNTFKLKLRTAVLIEHMAHMVSQKYGDSAHQMLHFFYLNDVPYDAMTQLSEMGYCSSPNSVNIKGRMQIEVIAAQNSLLDTIRDENILVMLLLDDFNNVRRTIEARSNGTFSLAGHYTSICFKLIDKPKCGAGEWALPSGLLDLFGDLPCGATAAGVIANNPDREFWIHPLNVDINLAISYVHRVVERLEINQPYLCFPVDLKYRRLDNPYASQQRLQCRNGVDHGPVSLDTLRPYEVAPIEMKGLQGVAMALERVKPVISEYLKNHDYCPIGGDWGLYYYLRKYLFSSDGWNDAIASRIIPLPGLFHIGLNCQECIILKYDSFLSALWKLVYPKAKTEFSVATTKMSPSRRKGFLAKIMNAWKKIRTEVLSTVAMEGDSIISVQWVSLIDLLEEFLALLLNIYDCSLNGPDYWEKYHMLLVRALRMFARTGKKHYVALVMMWISDIVYWKNYKPTFYNFVRTNLHLLSEEEVELFHSTIRPYAPVGMLIRTHLFFSNSPLSA